MPENQIPHKRILFGSYLRFGSGKNWCARDREKKNRKERERERQKEKIFVC